MINRPLTEAEIQKQIMDYLNDIGGLVLRLNSGRAKYNMTPCPPGTPDLLAILPYVTLWIEVKTKAGIVSPVQKKMHTELIRMKQRVIVARCLEDVVQELKK